MEQGNEQPSDAAAAAITTKNALRDNDKDVSAASHPLQDVIFEAPKVDVDVDFVRHVDVAHIDEPVTKVECMIPFPSNNNRKENWVKFDDEVGETGENSKTKSKYNNNNNRSSDFGRENSTAATVNKLSPLPAPDKKRQQTSVAASAASSPSGITTIRPRTPIESKPIQPQQSVLSAQVQPVAVASSSVPDIAPAILTTESTHVNLNGSGRKQQHHTPQLQHQQQHQIKPKAEAVFAATSSNPHPQPPHHSNNGISSSTGGTSVPIPVESVPGMRTIELSTGRIREGFANGDVIVTLLPANTKWPWITPAIFRPELVPEELMAQGLTLTVEEYVNAMETLVNDYRFTVYNICYKRILVCWILFAFAVLLTLLFSGLQGVALFSLGVGWLFLNAAAIFFCMWIKLRLSRGLEKCMARVNKQLMKHKILLVLDDRGRISCHKVNLCFMYFDPTQCINFLNDFLEQTDQNGGEAIKAGWESKLDIDVNDIVIQGNNPVRLSRKQAVAQELFLSYLQRWGKDFLRRRLDWTVQEAGVHETPRHLQSSICPCQYEEEILRNKIKTHFKGRQCCGMNCIGCWL